MSRSALPRAMVCVCFLLLAAPTIVVGQSYTVTTLEPSATNAGNFSRAQSINNDGVVIGEGSATFTSGIIHIWRPGQFPEPQYLYNYNQSRLARINDLGQFIGNVNKPNGWHGALGPVDLGLGAVNDINNKSQVVGWTYDSSYIFKDGVFDYLPTSYWGSEANAINDSGVAAGYWISDCTQDCFSEICMFRNDSMFLLGAPVGNYGEAYDINNKGQIVGWYSLCGNCSDSRGFIWDQGTWTTIPTLGGTSSDARAINDFGVVVGESRYTSGPSSLPTAIIYDTANGLRDLNTLIPAGTGWDLWAGFDINERGEIVGVGMYNGVLRGFLLTPPPSLILVDALDEVMPNQTVVISKVQYDPPAFTEELIGVYTSDSNGEIPVDTLVIRPGDTIKVSLLAHREPSVKHPSLLGTMYTVHLDNAVFDSNGAMSYTEVGGGLNRIAMGHTTIAWNLLVSVEWDADLAYLGSLQNGLRLMSNYLYDVFDGQVRLDTVLIFDGRQYWDSADVWIHATNDQWPEAFPADRSAGLGVYTATTGRVIKYPRMFYFNSADANRNLTWSSYPYSWTAALTQYDFDGAGGNPPLSKAYCPARTLAHEFGHYALGFRDEYMDTLKVSVFPGPNTPGGPATVYDFGMMDDQLNPNVAQCSELSCSLQYANVNHRITRHYQLRGNRSCWDWLESDIGEDFDSVWCELVKPTERGVGTAMFKGPNDSIPLLDYDVGALVVFPILHGAPATSTATVAVFDAVTGDSVPDVKVLLKQTALGTTLDQGYTADTGRIYVLGYQVGDVVQSSGKRVVIEASSAAALAAVSEIWLFGEAVFGGSGVSRLGNFYRSASAGDSLDIFLSAVSGYHPLVCRADFSGGGTALSLSSVAPFASPPSVIHVPGGGNETVPYAFAPAVGGYSVLLPDSLASEGGLNIWAVDDSGRTFFFPTRYTVASLDSVPLLREVFGPGISAELTFDALDQTTRRVMMMASPYPVIRDGLLAQARQAGECYSIAVEPDGPLSGYSRLTIRYAESDLGNTVEELSTESSLQIFTWNETTRQWDLQGGEVNLEDNEVSAVIDQPGVYAAFTTQTPTGVGDGTGELNLPNRFELSQNNPNPFNPVTGISYSVPSRTHVTLDVFNVLGRRVRTLVNEDKAAGTYRIIWNGLDDGGNPVPTGVYLYRCSAGGVVKTKKMLLLK